MIQSSKFSQGDHMTEYTGTNPSKGACMKNKTITAISIVVVTAMVLFCGSAQAESLRDVVQDAGENTGKRAVDDTADDRYAGAREKVREEMNKEDSDKEEVRDQQVQEQETEKPQEPEQQEPEQNTAEPNK